MNIYFRLYNNGNGKDPGHIQWEQEVLTPLAGTGRLYALISSNWWSQVKTAGSAVYANRHYLGESFFIFKIIFFVAFCLISLITS